MLEETIAAIATPPGEGGIGIIRISGEEAKTILDKVFVPVNVNSLENRKMAYGNIVDPSSKKIIDEVLCVELEDTASADHLLNAERHVCNGIQLDTLVTGP